MDTGYEAKFDFPVRVAGPERPYLLATVPRSGSTYLSHVLWRTGCLGAPLEYLNFDPAGPWGFANGSPAEQQRLWLSAQRIRTSPNGKIVGKIANGGPKKLSKGTKIHATAWYDNSTANKSNPDPTKDVKWGDQTWEEMMFTGLTFSIDAMPVSATAGQKN